jgi:hypothetical protein
MIRCIILLIWLCLCLWSAIPCLHKRCEYCAPCILRGDAAIHHFVPSYYLSICYWIHWTLLFLSGEDGESSDSSLNMECNQVLRVKSIYISSAILAAKSPFFYKVILIRAWNELSVHCSVLYQANNAITFFLLAFLKWHERIWSEACNSSNNCFR